MPWVVEAAFGWCPEVDGRQVTGINWSPGIINPFRQIGRSGPSLDAILTDQDADEDEPVVLVLHMACARVEYTDRGKSNVVVEESSKSAAIIGAVQGVTKKWAKQRKREEREASARQNRHYVMTQTYHVSTKEAAWDIMEEAYLKASANGTLPALVRQIMYAARPYIQRNSDRRLGKDFSQYFAQTLLA